MCKRTYSFGLVCSVGHVFTGKLDVAAISCQRLEIAASASVLVFFLVSLSGLFSLILARLAS
jgi:hypothetical protein